MNRIDLRRFFAGLLMAIVLLTGTACTFTIPNALAGESRDTNEISNFKGDSSSVNQSYHNLQNAAHEFRDNFRADITNGRRSPTQEKMNAPEQAVKNMGKNTRDAFGRAANSVKDAIDPG